jgi:hypothetical protein
MRLFAGSSKFIANYIIKMIQRVSAHKSSISENQGSRFYSMALSEIPLLLL